MKKTYYTVRDIERLTGVPRQRIHRLVYDGKLKPTALGALGENLFSRSRVVSLLKTLKVEIPAALKA